MRNYFSWVIGIGLFVWATFGLVSILSKLHFAMDAWSWCVARVPISQRPILVEFRHHVSDWVASYRELVHEIAQTLHLPRLPQLIYDAVGVVAFSIGRGQWIGRRADMRAADFVLESGELDHLETDDEMLAGLYRRFPLEGLKDKITFLLRQQIVNHLSRVWMKRPQVWRNLTAQMALILVYGGIVALVLAALFGIDFLYRHFA